MTSTPPAAEVRLRQRLLRRWRLVAVGIIATIGLCVAATVLVPPKYTAGAIILLTPPPTTGPNGSPNPYLALGGMQPVADVLARTLMSDATLNDLRAAGLIGTYTVARDPLSDGPILDVTITSASSAAALRDLGLLVSAAEPRLNALQAAESIPTKDRLSAQAVASATKAKASRKSQIRAIVVAVAVGLIGTVLAATLLDVLLLRRRSRRAAGEPGVAQADPMAAPLAMVAAIPSQQRAEGQSIADDPDVGEPAAGDGRRRLPRVRERMRWGAKTRTAMGDVVRSGVRAEPDSLTGIAELLDAASDEDDAFGDDDVLQEGAEAIAGPTSEVDMSYNDAHNAAVGVSEPASSRPVMDALAQPVVPTRWRRVPGRAHARMRSRGKSELSESGAGDTSEATTPGDRVGASSR